MKQSLVKLVGLVGLFGLVLPSAYAAVGNVIIDQSVSGSITAQNVTGVKFIDSANSSYFLDPAATGNSLTIAGAVGIGTTAPVGKLEVSGAVVGKALGIFNETGNQNILVASASGTNRFVITNAGSVGIGTAAPAEKLHVGAGNIMIDNNQYIKTKKPGGTVVNMIGMDNSGLGTLNIQIGELGGKILAHDGSTQRIGIDNNGNVSFATLTGSGNRAVYSDPSGYLTNSSSDIRLKKNIVAISSEIDVLASLDRLRGIYYNWDTSVDAAKNLGSQRELGMIAQEVELVLPELVGTNVTGYKSLDYSKMTGFLIEVTKAQQNEIDQLKADNAALKHKVSEHDELKARLHRLEIMVYGESQ